MNSNEYGKSIVFALTLLSVPLVGCFQAEEGDSNQSSTQTSDQQGNPNINPNQQAQNLLQNADNNTQAPDVSPVRRIERPLFGGNAPRDRHEDRREIDGSNNNLKEPEMGAAHTQLRRWMPSDYSDDIYELAGDNRKNPRVISNLVNAQTVSLPNPLSASDYLWQWGQFLDHDIGLTDGADPAESINIEVSTGDAYFDPDSTGAVTMAVNRSLYDPETGNLANDPRQQINEITAWIDASNVYGSDEERASALRTLDGSGRLKTSEGDFLPFNTDGLSNAGGTSDALFLAGDVRANEQVGLTAMHTLFVREHNWWVEKISAEQPNLGGEELYWAARRMIEAEIQVITYQEYLPLLLGDSALSSYSGYKPNEDGRIMNLFAHGVYRYGHTALSPELLRVDVNSNEIAEGHLPLRNAFFSPYRLATEGGIEPILRGLAQQVHEGIDVFVIDDVRNFLFGDPGEGGFDLVSLNIQRGRDHGLPSYNDVRSAFGLTPVTAFSQITTDVDVQNSLAQAYTSVDDIDLWLGGLAEDAVEGALVGELLLTVMAKQFELLRDADRFWYQNRLTASQRRVVEATTLADIIRRNTDIGSELSNDVFIVNTSAGQ